MTELLKFRDVIDNLLSEKTNALSEKHFVLVILNQELSHLLHTIDTEARQLQTFCQQVTKAISNHLLKHKLHPYMSEQRLLRLIEDPKAFIARWQNLNFGNILNQYFHSKSVNLTV